MRSDEERESERLRFYNTLTNSVEPFVPIERSNIRMYVCGPTVYNNIHIGNARPVVVFDLLYRLLKWVYGEDNVTYTRNITDIDDKISNIVKTQSGHAPYFDLHKKAKEFTGGFIHSFNIDCIALGCLQPSYTPKASDFITDMQVMIKTLIEKGHTYEKGGNVYFAAASYPKHGLLAGRDFEATKVARISKDPDKRHPADFLLWKHSVPDKDFAYDSPWGWGRPGWHIECSTMAKHFLGPTFDIHGGGQDLIFPHHENEITQSCCANDTDKMARYWLHNGFVTVNDKKMSKSDGSMITIADLMGSTKFAGQIWDGQVLRWLLLRSHYRHPLNFSAEVLFDAQRSLRELFFRCRLTHGVGVRRRHVAVDIEFIMALSDDLNTPRAIARLFAITDSYRIGDALLLMGFNPAQPLGSKDSEEDVIQSLIVQRNYARQEKDWKESDKIRDVLDKMGIKVKDSVTGSLSTWERVK